MAARSTSRPWPGLVPWARRLLLGEARPPKARRRGPTSTRTTSSYYEGMPGGYRWFRRDELVRRCIVTNAYFATMTAGFEIVLDGDGDPARLIPLQSDTLKPNVSGAWELTGFRYQGRDGFYAPREVLYFVNLQLEADHEGLSDVEPVIDVCQARHELLGENFPEIVRTLWAPYVILRADTTGLSREDADRAVDDLAEVARAGKSIAVNESVEATVVDHTPDMRGLCELLDRLDRAVAANFGTPRLLLGRPVENRATAYAELEAYVDGPVRHVQRYLARELERQWYDHWTLKILEDEGEAIAEGETPPIRVKHRWRRVRTADIIEMAKASAVLYSRGEGAIDRRKVYEMLGWDLSELEE
ncbi:MAG: phage portal protein [Candidatus Bathyarchaeota archaeon]|nr:phage portal protein [Candidatus Bathyarchaeota archaeon]